MSMLHGIETRSLEAAIEDAQRDANEIRLELASTRERYATTLASFSERERAIEQQRATELERIEREQQAKVKEAAAAAARVRDAADRRVREYQAQLAAARTASSDAGEGASAAEKCEAEAAAAAMLADLLGRAVSRAGILADEADSARAAGLACEQAYSVIEGP